MVSAGPQLTWSVSPFAWGSVRWFTLLWISELLACYWLLARQVRRGAGSDEDASDLAVYLWFGLLIGARLGEGLFYNLDQLSSDPSWLLKLGGGGLSGHGAALGCMVAAWLYARRRALAPLDVTDRVTFAFSAAAIVHRLATFLNSDLVGRPTDGSWGVRFPYSDGTGYAPLRHPTQLYEAALGVLVLSLLWLADQRWNREERPRGALTGLALLSYFAGRFLLDFSREPLGDSQSLLNTGQWLSLPFILAGAMVLLRSFRRRAPAGFRLLEEAPESAPQAPH